MSEKSRKKELKKKRREKRRKEKIKKDVFKAKSGEAKLIEKINKSKFFSGKSFLIEPKGEEKMSEVILGFAEPLLNACNDDEITKKAIIFAITVWNLSLLPEKEKGKLTQEIISKLSPSDYAQDIDITKYYVKLLLERKKKIFPNNKRMIMNYQFSNDGGDCRLIVASAIPR